MDIDKSSRHKKIVGDLGEQLVCNWLSRSGWEVVLVDHTGIDIVAYHRSDAHHEMIQFARSQKISFFLSNKTELLCSTATNSSGRCDNALFTTLRRS